LLKIPNNDDWLRRELRLTIGCEIELSPIPKRVDTELSPAPLSKSALLSQEDGNPDFPFEQNTNPN
jgi:hypothetical protein